MTVSFITVWQSSRRRRLCTVTKFYVWLWVSSKSSCQSVSPSGQDLVFTTWVWLKDKSQVHSPRSGLDHRRLQQGTRTVSRDFCALFGWTGVEGFMWGSRLPWGGTGLRISPKSHLTETFIQDIYLFVLVVVYSFLMGCSESGWRQKSLDK